MMALLPLMSQGIGLGPPWFYRRKAQTSDPMENQLFMPSKRLLGLTKIKHWSSVCSQNTNWRHVYNPRHDYNTFRTFNILLCYVCLCIMTRHQIFWNTKKTLPMTKSAYQKSNLSTNISLYTIQSAKFSAVIVFAIANVHFTDNLVMWWLLPKEPNITQICGYQTNFFVKRFSYPHWLGKRSPARACECL